MTLHSAGILLYRHAGRRIEVLLVHPGGPFWAGKDVAAWSIPKGIVDENETLLGAARREFREETGCRVDGDFMPLGEIRQPGGKIVHVWALEGDLDATQTRSNRFALEWPRGSGRVQEYPEVDKAQWFELDEASVRIVCGQAGFLERLASKLREVR